MFQQNDSPNKFNKCKNVWPCSCLASHLTNTNEHDDPFAHCFFRQLAWSANIKFTLNFHVFRFDILSALQFRVHFSWFLFESTIFYVVDENIIIIKAFRRTEMTWEKSLSCNRIFRKRRKKRCVYSRLLNAK